MEQNHKTEMIRTINALIKNDFFNNRAIFLFGHCNATEEMADYLLAHNIKPAAIFDNSISKQGLSYREIPIIPPKNIQKNSIVLIATRFFAEMSAQLRQLGFNGEIIQVVEYNSFVEFSLSDETLERKTARMQRGAKILKQIRAQYPPQHLVICPNNALGDVYWAMAFLPHYLEKHNISEFAVIVVGNNCKQVAKLFDIKNILTLENTEMDEFVQAIIFSREENCIIAHHDRPYTDNIIRYLDKKFLSFIDYYRYAVYGLAKNTSACSPTKFEAFENHKQIPKGKSVILSPYAKSVVELPNKFWEEIAIEYSNQGYKVYTNTRDCEQSICGTEPLNIPISQIKSAVEYAGTFIGIRSGLCDVLHTADCRKIVVFPDCFYSTTPHKVKDFFALPEWQEIIYENRQILGL